MRTTSFLPRITWVVTLVAVALCPAMVWAGEDSEALQRAIEQYEQGAYLDAQELLVGIDVDALTDDERDTRQRYLDQLRMAINMSMKAARDFEDANMAIESIADAEDISAAQSELESARALLSSILENEFAHPSLKQDAKRMLGELTDFDDLIEQAGDGGTIEVMIADEPGDDMEGDEADELGEKPMVEMEVVEEPAGPSPEDVARARTLVAEGQELTDAGQYDQAEQMYNQALEMVPGYPEAIDGLAALQAHRENAFGSRGGDLIDKIKFRNLLAWQRAETAYRKTESMIRDLVSRHNYDEARSLLHRARQIIESNRQFADPPSQYEAIKREFEALTDEVKTAERKYQQSEQARIEREVEETRKKRLRQFEERKTRNIESLMDQAGQHKKDGDLDAAIKVLDQVLVIDPNYEPAEWQRDLLEERMQFRRQRELDQVKRRETQDTLIEVDDAKIPWHKIIQYPKNWPEISNSPERGRPSLNRPGSLLLSALDRRVPVNIQGKPFHQVIQMLADQQQINLMLDRADLIKAGVDLDTPIELRLPQEITLRKALTEVCNQAGMGMVELGFEASDNVIKVATREYLDSKTYPAVYDISELLMQVPNFTDAPMTDLSRYNSYNMPTRVEDDRRYVFGDTPGDEPEYDPAREDRVSQIISLIRETVAPESWRANNGTIGTIREINNQLVITQNTATQQQIGGLLEKLREQRALQIGIEARFLTVASHYLEELGIDLDIVLNAGNAGFDIQPSGIGDQPITTDPVLGSRLLVPREFTVLGFTPAAPANLGTAFQPPQGGGGGGAGLQQPFIVPGYVPQRTGSRNSLTPIPIGSNTTSATNPQNITHDIPGTFAGGSIQPALNIFGSFLDNIQVDFLIRATQADSRNSVLTAPRLVLFNGQRSWVAVTVQTNFVSQLIPQVATGAAAQAPQTGTINAGAVLDVQATVTSDKRYVTMTLRPGVTRLNQLSTFQSSGGGTAGDAFVQLPELSSQLIKTTVSVPDGGTLLIGGQKLAAETEVDAGVPVLSKIPVLKNLYSSRTLVKDEQTLLILIKPTILIQAEQEQRAFPSLSSR